MAKMKLKTLLKKREWAEQERLKRIRDIHALLLKTYGPDREIDVDVKVDGVVASLASWPALKLLSQMATDYDLAVRALVERVTDLDFSLRGN